MVEGRKKKRKSSRKCLFQKRFNSASGRQQSISNKFQKAKFIINSKAETFPASLYICKIHDTESEIVKPYAPRKY